MEEEPELMYWTPSPKVPVPLPPPPPPPMFTPIPPAPSYLMSLPPPASGLCYPVTDVPSFSGRQTTDNLIQEEVTRAAKTLFSKRNRTLMHWLNPDISMNQLKMEVNAAWECLPPAEKVFYISQVLGKFAPHTTSLMVNPQLDPTMGGGVGTGVSTVTNTERIDMSTESGAARGQTRRRASTFKVKKPRVPKRRAEYSSDEDASGDSGLVVDLDRVKRKYTRRKTPSTDQGAECSSSCAPTTSAAEPRVKRKYVKRKLVRKKYKKRETKNKTADTQEEVVTSSVPEPQPPSGEDLGVWVELGDTDLTEGIGDFKLSSEEVDSFWANIDDPSKFFIELEIE